MLRFLRRRPVGLPPSKMDPSDVYHEELAATESPSNVEIEEAPWEDQARKHQQMYLQMFGDCLYLSFRRKIPSICNLLLDSFCKCHQGDGSCENESELSVLKQNICHAIFGQPTENATEGNRFTGFPKDKLNAAEKVFDQIVSHQNGKKVLMAFLYVSLEKSGKVIDYVVCRFPSPVNTEEFWYVDFLGRLYKNWDDFLSNNKLPASKWCYPKDGFYAGDTEGKVELCYGLTPAATTAQRVLNSVDTVATVATVGAGIGAFFPPVAIPCVVACGVVSAYTAARGSLELIDRGSHGQSLRDRESARQWISVLGSTLGLGSAGGMTAVKFLAREGKTVSELVCGLVTGLNFSSMFVNGVGIVENIITIKEQDEWSTLQILQLTSSVLFYAHSVVNFRTARSLYVETQNQILDDHGVGLSKRQRKLFDGIQRETLKGEPDPIVGRAKIIKDLNHINDKNEFFSRILKSNKSAKANSEPIKKFKFGNFVGSEEGTTSFKASFAQPSNPTFITPQATSSDSIPVHEPAMFTNIKMLLKNITSSDVDRLLVLLGAVCEKWRYGRKFMRALRIIMDCVSCRGINEVLRIIEAAMELSKELWEEIIQSRLSGGGSSDESYEEEEMGFIMEDVSFVPRVLHTLSIQEINEDVFHFPSDHRAWGKNGELDPDEYVLIGQNAFGIANVQVANITHEGDTANVYFEHVGLVTITSYVKECKIVVKKFKRSDENTYQSVL